MSMKVTVTEPTHAAAVATADQWVPRLSHWLTHNAHTKPTFLPSEVLHNQITM